jgi:arylsulfatase A-like enzyme
LFPTDASGAAISTDTPPHIEKAQRYDQEIRYMDDELGGLLAELDDLGLSGNTVFIVTSDHGEGFLEHGFYLHSAFLFEEVTHVPLLMRGPGIPRGLRIAAPVGHVDLASTVASFFDVEPPPGSRGIDLRRTFQDTNSVADGAFYFTESWGTIALRPDGPIDFFTPAFSVRQGHRKVARYPNKDGSHRFECYALDDDPGEETNLCADGTPEPADLVAALDAYEDVTARRRAQIVPPDGAHREEPATLPLDPKQKDKLRALGYLQ